jgi:hypothetical protein
MDLKTGAVVQSLKPIYRESNRLDRIQESVVCFKLDINLTSDQLKSFIDYFNLASEENGLLSTG